MGAETILTTETIIWKPGFRVPSSAKCLKDEAYYAIIRGTSVPQNDEFWQAKALSFGNYAFGIWSFAVHFQMNCFLFLKNMQMHVYSYVLFERNFYPSFQSQSSICLGIFRLHCSSNRS